MFGRRILLLAPHPQDEVIGCFGAISRARAAGARIQVLYLTSGLHLTSGPHLTSGLHLTGGPPAARRRAEAEAAATHLGLEPLGFGSIPAGRLKDHLPEARAAIEAALAGGVSGGKAELLWTPAYEGGHQDLDATNVLAAGFRERVRVWEFSEYNLAAGRLASHRFPAQSGKELTVRLDAAAAQAKRAALALYASEWSRLRHIACRQEVFRPLPVHDYARPPHAGPLCYQRIHFLGFRPRSGRSRPETLKAALRRYDGAASWKSAA